MNIDTLIKSLTNNKTANIIVNNKPKLTWLAKYDDYASMGILSQRLLEQLDNKVRFDHYFAECGCVYYRTDYSTYGSCNLIEIYKKIIKTIKCAIPAITLYAFNESSIFSVTIYLFFKYK
jgi:hypothetical protein